MRNIVMGKLVDHTIDDEYEDLSERLFGEGNCFNSSEVRKRMYGMRTITPYAMKSSCLHWRPDALSCSRNDRSSLTREMHSTN